MTDTRATGGPRGRIFDIKLFSVHDGPGIRTTVFFKGCPLRCAWCHNPEAISAAPQVALYEQKCVGCRACLAACPTGAHAVSEDGTHVFRHDLCQACGRCVETCYAEALTMYGRDVSVDEVMAAILEDRSFYERSAGGVTLSGGEPLLQPEFSAALLQACKSEGIHTALDTCGQVAWAAFEQVLPRTDMFLYDLKHMDAEQHRRWTGVSNRLILENLERLDRTGIPIEIRIPVVPTVNDGADNLEATSAFLARLDHIAGVRLLAYHRLAGGKYAALGMGNTLPDVEPPSREHMEAVAGRLRAHGLVVVL